MTILIIPGLHNSGPDHWQSHFERELDGCIRVQQENWDTPVCRDWIATVDAAVSSRGDDVLLVAHSLGCSTVAHWAAKYKRVVKGALLVGPSDVEAPSYPPGTSGFAPIALDRLPFPSIVVASRNDPFVSFERAQCFASCWGSQLDDVGNALHINTESGHGPWPHGKELLGRLMIDVATAPLTIP